MSPELIIKAIDSIAKLLPNIKSLNGARIKQYFDDLVTPLCEDIDQVHCLYNELF